MKSECSGEKSTLRSASPHRNAYRAQFQALRMNFDEEQETGATSQQTRGRKYGSNVNRIKKIFMQMGTEPSESADGTAKTRGRSSLLSPERRNRPIEIVEKADGSVVQLEASVSERISRFDAMRDESSQFTETRKVFKRNEETQPSKHYSSKKEKERQDELCISKSNKATAQEDLVGSSSSKAETISPAVSQLSAVFENIDAPKDVIVSEKESSVEFTVTGHYPLNLSAVNKDLSSTVGNLDGFSPLKDTSAWPLLKQNTSSVSLENSSQTPTTINEESKSTLPVSKTNETQLKSDYYSSGPSEILEQDIIEGFNKQDLSENKVETESKASSLPKKIFDGAENTEMPGNLAVIDDTDFHVASFSVENRNAREVQKEQDDFQSSHGSKHDDCNVHKIESRYSFDWGEICTEEDDQEDSEDNSYYEPDTEYFEISGLSEEDEIPPSRKIKFSTAPIKVFNTYSDEEYDRRNESVDPISSSAEYELEKRVEKLDLFPIDIEKDEQGFGITIIGMGIGIDTGFEKLGIFVKTITEDGPAEKDGRMRLNDQIIEVDGVNMVGVSQDFASAVLRRTKGRVRFIIGREKAGQVSEVGKLIKQTIEYDQRHRGRHYAHYEADDDDDETEEYATDEDEEDIGAFSRGRKTTHFFECPENDDMLSPKELERLTQKFKELQVKHSITETEIKQLKRKLQIAENEKVRWQMERNILHQNIRENKERMAKIEGYWVEAQSLCHNVNEHLKDSQEQYQALEKKYNKAKKLIKDFQEKELEFMKYHDDDKKKIEDLEKAHFLEVQHLQARIRKLEAEVFELLKQNESQMNNNNNIFEQQISVGESSKEDTAETLDALDQEGAIKGVDPNDVFDFNEAVPETERVDSKALKTRLQLSVKNKRSPTRTRLCDSISSTDGEDSLERKNITFNDNFNPSSTSSADLSGLGTSGLGSKTPGFSHCVVVSSDEILDDGQSPKHSQFPNCAVSEWSVQQVSNWLKSLNLEHCISEFTAHNINGECLLQLDGSKLKLLGMTSSQERAVIKKKIKEMKANLEKARKAQKKMEKKKKKLKKNENVSVSKKV